MEDYAPPQAAKVPLIGRQKRTPHARRLTLSHFSFLISIFSLQIPADARPDWENRHFISEGECLMKRFPHPRRKCACESRRAGASQARFEKSPRGRGRKP